jgi:hypothetical protein
LLEAASRINISYEVFLVKSKKLFLPFIGQPCRRHNPSLPPSLPPFLLVTKYNKLQNKQTNKKPPMKK